MSTPTTTSPQEPNVDYPATWDLETLRQNWIRQVEAFAEENELSIPAKRLRQQVEQSTIYQEMLQRWPRMDANQRLKAWKILLECNENIARDVLPACVQCGECCRKGSPTLHMEDLELLQQGKIPWHQLVTLRRGEPVRSPFQEEIFFLMDERIKLREKPQTQECVFLDGDTQNCTIYLDRPLQCRAQACWDPSQAEELKKEPYLTRRDIFSNLELLPELLAEHDQRCAFTKLQEACQRLEKDSASGVDEVLQLLAYENHFRQFFSEQFNIPANTLELVFGRSFADLVRLFGLRVEQQADGTRCLVPDDDRGGR